MSTAALIAVVLAILALARMRAATRLEERIARLERELAQLRVQLAGTAPGAVPAAPTAEPEAFEAETAAQGRLQQQSAEPLPALPPMEAPQSAGDESVSTPPAWPGAGLEIDWERWIGVRGAAVLGGVVLALAGLFFFRYSIEHGLIPPWLRVVLGVLVGVGGIAGAEWRLRERYAATADALAGGSVVVLYAAFWAAGMLYHLVATPVAFALMILVTVTAAALSWRYGALVIAVIGLTGGFATPFLLSSGTDRPIGLFAYLLLLDLGLLVLAQRRDWPVLALLSLGGTALYEASWIFLRMGADRLPLGLAILGLFALVFAVAGRTAKEDAQGHWWLSQAAGILFPFALALYFAGAARFGAHLYPVAVLLLVLSAAACWIGRVQARPLLPLGSAAAVVAVVAVWLFTRRFDDALTWELALLCVAFAGLFHLFVELAAAPRQRFGGPLPDGSLRAAKSGGLPVGDPARSGLDTAGPAAIVAAAGLLGLLVMATLVIADARLWPLLAGWLGVGGCLARHGTFSGRERVQLVPAAAVALGLSLFQSYQWATPTFPAPPEYLATILGVGVLFQALAMVRAGHRAPGVGPTAPDVWLWSERAAALFALLVLAPLSGFELTLLASPALLLFAEVLLGCLAALAAARLGSGRWLLAAMLTTALGHTVWGRWYVSPHRGAAGLAAALAVQLSAAVVFTVWPFATWPRFRADRWAWYAAALAPVAWFSVLLTTWKARFGDAFTGALPLLLAGLVLLAAARARQAWPETEAQRERVLVWLLAVALGFITAAIPLQLEKQWITIGWALEAAALVLLWQRFDHPGLKYVAVALALGVTIRLVANPAVLGYSPRPAWRIINWLMYTYLVPAAALLQMATTLQRNEVARLRRWEEAVYAAGYPIGALVAGLGGLVVIFVWLNLAIADWFATGTTLRVSFQRLPARDLATSITWAAYALVLLALGVRRASRALRWVSLGLMMVTIGKVFLYDLGELHDLYRVGSLLGLAISLIVVSLAYQRFVLRKAPEEKP